MEASLKVSLERFQARLNSEPNPKELVKTSDSKAFDLPISYVEMTLDEMFFGLWETKNFTATVIANEVIGNIELSVFHPVAEKWITRSGNGAIVITVDAVPDGVRGREKNLFAQDLANKKPNALDLTYPKLKTECIKNAAKSLGKLFGRDLNRKEKTDFYNPLIIGNEATKVSVVKRAVLLGNFNEAENLMALFPELSVEKKEELRELIRNAKTSLVAA